MKKVIVFLFLLGTIQVYGQGGYKVSKSSGKLVIEDVNSLTVEGYSGNEIIFSSLDGERENDPRSQGLRAISNMGLEDNTGLGLSVVDKGTVIEVHQLKKVDGPKVKIMLPKGVNISIKHSSHYGNDIRLKNVESEVEISTVHNKVFLENVTGPMAIKTVHGDVDADLSSNVKGPISIVSVHGHVDVAINTALKANMSLSSHYGEIFVDPAIKIDIQSQGEFVKYGSDKITGKMNGGGLDLSMVSTHNNIYIRKK